MAVGDGVTWNEAVPDNSTIANQIDDYNRDLRVGISARMRHEHVWPTSQTATADAGYHKFVTFQPQTGAPTMGGTTGGGLYVTTDSSPALMFVRSDGTNVTLVNSLGGVVAISGGTVGAIPLCSSANPGGLTVLAPGSSGDVLTCAGDSANATWGSKFSLNVWTSTWFTITADNTYTKTHDLGTTLVLWQIYISQDATGSAPSVYYSGYDDGYAEDSEGGIALRDISTSTCSLKFSTHFQLADGTGGKDRYTSGVAQIIGVAVT